MAEDISESVIVKGIGPSITGILLALLTWVTAGATGVVGSPLTDFLVALGGILGLALAVMFRRYLFLLGTSAERRRSPKRQDYDSLRESLSGGGVAARLYTNNLTSFLNSVDRFFGDDKMADRTLLRHAFGLNTPAPLWTAPAFDRCLVIALVYPIATILIFWLISGHVGPAEAALNLKPNSTELRRAITVIAIGLQVFAMWRFTRTYRWKAFGWAVLAFLVAIALTITVSVAAASAAAVALSTVFGISVSFIGALALSVACIFSFMLAAAIAVPNVSTVFPAFAVAGGFAIALLSNRAIPIDHPRKGLFLLFFTPVAILACLGAARFMSDLPVWEFVGPVLLFGAFLTLLNAPFDWVSIGLTRALLRRGLELGGWWPFLLSLSDAVLATLLIALLVPVIVIGVQTFDGIAEYGGGERILPLDRFFNGIASHPAAAEYWWVYALLLSTMIPSLFNLAIGGFSLMRGLPGLPSVLLRFMPTSSAIASYDRTWIALVLTLQVVMGVLVGFLAQAALTVAIFGFVMPLAGFELLQIARVTADFDVPTRVGHLLALML